MAEPGDLVDRSGTSMPPRPVMSDSTPAPLRKAPPPVAAVLASRSLWVSSVVVAAATVVFSFLARAQQLEPLGNLVSRLAPLLEDEERNAVAAAVIVGTLVVLGLIVTAEAILVRRMVVLARGGARWALLALVILNAAVSFIATSFITFGDWGPLSAGLLTGQLVLASAALVASFLPSATAWFRGEREARRSAGSVA